MNEVSVICISYHNRFSHVFGGSKCFYLIFTNAFSTFLTDTNT